MRKLWYYLRKLYHEYIACDIFIMNFSTKLEYGEILEASFGKIEVIWEERKDKYWRYWVREIKTYT